MSGLTAVLAGATGLVGGECLRRLLASRRYTRVVAVARRPLEHGGRHRKLGTVIVDFDRLDEVRRRGCAATTSSARSAPRSARPARRRASASWTTTTRCDLPNSPVGRGRVHFSLVSALGASRTSPFFYSRVKGELEDDLRRMGWPSLAMFRPSVIAGDRGESRPLERLGEQMLRFAPATWRPVAAGDIAAAMIATALGEPPGVTIVESRDIAAVAAGFSAGPA